MNAGALLSLCLAVSGRAAQVSGRAASPVGAPTAAVPPLSTALSAPTGALSADFQPGLLPSALGVAAAPDLPSAALSAPSPRAEAVPAADEPSAGAFSAAPLEISAPGPAAAAAVRRASRSEAAQESRDESSSRAQPARSSLAAAARGGALAVGELFDGQRPEPGAAREAAPDFPLTGASGEEVLSALRARADAALIEKDVREGKPTPAPGSTGRPEGWALRVDNWILGQQALVREPLTRWMAERSFVSRALGGTPLDVETFLVALAKVNAALDGLAPPIQAADLFVLGEAGLDEPRPDGPDLRAVGALHPGGRVHVLASFAQTLTPEELAAAVLREHLVLRGFPYGSAVKAMQAVTRKAFGRPVLAVDLRTAARLSLAGPREDGSPRWRPEAPFAPAPQEEPGWMRWHRAISVGLLVLAAATAIPLLAFWAASGRWAFAAVGLAAFLALGGGLFAAARRAGDWLEERWNRNAPARLLGGVEYRFDPASLRLVERNDGVDEGRDFRYAALIFEDARGWRVAVIPHAATTEGADDALEVQWGFQGLDDSSRGYFFILAPEELAGHPEAAGHLVTARDFDRDLLAAFERAANRYLRAPGRTSDERRAVRGLMRSFVRGLKGREGGRDGDEPDLQAA